jgi:hypothetical protein
MKVREYTTIEENLHYQSQESILPGGEEKTSSEGKGVQR